MAKILYTDGVGANQTLNEDADNIVEIYETTDDVDLSELDEGQIVATKGDNLDASAVTQAIINNASDEIDRLIAGSGVPAGTVVSMDNNAPVNGWLKCDGSTFDRNQYPFLYSALLSDTLPIVLDRNDDVVIDEEIMTGDFFEGHPVYKYSFKWPNAWTGNTWYQIDTGALQTALDIKQLVKSHIQGIENSSNAATEQTPYSLQLRSTGLWVYATTFTTTAVDKTVEMYYIKNTDDYTNAKYKYIRALSGTEATAEATQVTNAINQYRQALVDTSGVPCGTVVYGKYATTPDGYLKCDGSTFDENEYPILYAKLGNSNVLPTLYDKSSLPNQPNFRGTTRNNGYKGDIPLYSDLTALLQDAGIDISGPGFAKDGIMTFQDYNWQMIWIQDPDGSVWCLSQTGIPDTGTGYFSIPVKKGQKIYAITQTGGSANTQPAAGTYNSTIYYYINIWYYDDYAYIKAFSGVNDGTEANAVVDAIDDLKARVAYASMPLGNVIQMKDNSYTPVGYLLCDGRDTTGTADELETVYPLLYAYNGNSNVLPEIGDELDYEHVEYLTYDGSQANAASTQTTQNVSFTMAKAGLFIANITGYNGANGWVTVNGQVIDKMSSHSGTWLNDSSPCFPVKKGDVVAIHMGYTGNYTWYGYQQFIPYKTFKYIKAVSGVETASTEATEVANGISAAEAAMQTQYDTFVQNTRASLEIYSTTETVVGTWIDGKPIYRKVVPLYKDGAMEPNWVSNGSNLYTNTTDMPTGVDVLVNSRCMGKRATGDWFDNWNTTGGSYGFTTYPDAQRIWICFQWASKDIYLIFEYTKVGD